MLGLGRLKKKVKNRSKGAKGLAMTAILSLGLFQETVSEAFVQPFLGMSPKEYMTAVDERRAQKPVEPAIATHVPLTYTNQEIDSLEEHFISGQNSESSGNDFISAPEAKNVPEEDNLADINQDVESTESEIPAEAEESLLDEQEVESSHPSIPDQPDVTENKEQSTSNKESDTQQSSPAPKEESTTQETTQKETDEPVIEQIKEEAKTQIDEEQTEEHFQFSVVKNQTTNEFIAMIGEDAQEVAYANGLYASVMIAQAILETGSGNSTLSSAPNYNLFGIKGSYLGQKVVFNTQEDKGNGTWYTISSNFRKYPGYKESIEDYARLLKGGISGNAHFYAPVWKENAATYQEATAWLTGRYATDIHYNKKLDALINTYQLQRFDTSPALTQTVDEKEQLDTQAQENTKVTEETQQAKERQVLSASPQWSESSSASVQTKEARLQNNASANQYALQLKGKEPAGNEVVRDE